MLAVGFIHNGAQLLEGEGWNVIQYAVGAKEIAAVGIHLDPVGAEADLFAHGFTRLIGTIHKLHSMWHLDLPVVALERISAGHIHGATHDFHARPRNDAIVDCLFSSQHPRSRLL